MTSTLLAAATPHTGTGEAVLFWILAPVAVLAAAGIVLTRKAVHSALLLALTMVCLAIFYTVQDAPFLGVVQVVVYMGAVMMLFLFVLMLVGVQAADSLVETLRAQRTATVIAAVAFSVLVLGTVGNASVRLRGLDSANADGNVPAIAFKLFSTYFLAFEVTSALLITAALGAMVLAHRERVEPRATQRELSEERFRTGYGAPLPSPGVYARHNAVDTPALLPDGSPSELSLPRALVARGDARPVVLPLPSTTTVEDDDEGVQP